MTDEVAEAESVKAVKAEKAAVAAVAEEAVKAEEEAVAEEAEEADTSKKIKNYFVYNKMNTYYEPLIQTDPDFYVFELTSRFPQMYINVDNHDGEYLTLDPVNVADRLDFVVNKRKAGRLPKTLIEVGFDGIEDNPDNVNISFDLRNGIVTHLENVRPDELRKFMSWWEGGRRQYFVNFRYRQLFKETQREAAFVIPKHIQEQIRESVDISNIVPGVDYYILNPPDPIESVHQHLNRYTILNEENTVRVLGLHNPPRDPRTNVEIRSLIKVRFVLTNERLRLDAPRAAVKRRRGSFGGGKSPATSSKTKELKQLVSEFNRIAAKYSKYGLADSESSIALRAAVKGSLNVNQSDFGLFSKFSGDAEAKKGLTRLRNKARDIVSFVRANRASVKNYLKSTDNLRDA
jgi:hypothetical protein